MKDVWKKRNHRVLAGSYTVEAAVLLPVLLAVIIALMQICFTLHDRAVIRGILELSALQTVEGCSGADADVVLHNAAFVPEELERQLLITSITDAEIYKTRTGAKVLVRMEAKRLVPLYFGSGVGFVKEYSVMRKKPYAGEKTMMSEVLLDALNFLE